MIDIYKNNSFVIRIYRDDKFIGYIKNYRNYRDGLVFEKTNNINSAKNYVYRISCELSKEKLDKKRNKLYYNESFSFKVVKLTDNEIRKSKLHFLSVVKDFKETSGIFKRYIP